MIAAAVVSCLAALLLIPALASWARSRNLLDVPNERSSHTQPTPRVGGVGIVAGVAAGELAGWALGVPPLQHASVIAAGAAAIVALSVADDLASLPALARLLVQSVIAGGVVWQAAPAMTSGALPVAAGLASLVVAVWIVGLVNAYNFMDGIDGIAGGQAVVAAAGWTLVGLAAGIPALTAAALTIGAACAAFLCFNIPRARVFMGDGGSAFLGFAFAVPPLAALLPGSGIAAAACFVWPFLFDTTFTLFRRLRRGENVLQAHRSHLYQRLVSTGWTHLRVSLTYAALATLGLPAGVALATGRWTAFFLTGPLLALGALWLWITLVRRERRATVGRAAPPTGTAARRVSGSS